MRRFLQKLSFIHHRLWRRDGIYPAALLLGPAPLLGGVFAFTVWIAIAVLGGTATNHASLHWAVPQRAAVWDTDAERPQAPQPAKPLPPIAADGTLTGYEAGWRLTTSPIQVSPTLDVDLKAVALTTFSLEGGSVDMAQIKDHGPKTSLYVGVGNGFLVVKDGGVYALSARLERPAASVADCLVRLGFGPRRIVSDLGVGISSELSKTFEPVRFSLQPGLFPIGWAFGCWHDGEVVGPGRMSLLISHPGERDLQPAGPGDIVRLKSAAP